MRRNTPILHPRILGVYSFYRQNPLYGTLPRRYFFPHGTFAIKADHLGSVSTITDQSGYAIENTTYEPFGAIVSGGAKSRFDYTGKEFDSVVGDYDFNARKYKAELGIFTQPDAVFPDVYDPQQLNRYSYARNNPYIYVDDTGRAAVQIHFIDTFKSYFKATGDPVLAVDMARHAIEPDLYRYAQNEGALGQLSRGTAAVLGLDLQMDVMGGAAEGYYHEGKDYGTGMSVDLQGAFDRALSKGDIGAMGNLEHALGHDVGSSGVPGYHGPEILGGERSKASHLTNDMFSTSTDRAALNRAQLERAEGTRQLSPLNQAWQNIRGRARNLLDRITGKKDKK